MSINTIGLQRLYALVFLEHGTRTLHVAGVTAHPTAAWAAQAARNVATDLGARMDSLRFLIRDRDSMYTDALGTVFQADPAPHSVPTWLWALTRGRVRPIAARLRGASRTVRGWP